MRQCVLKKFNRYQTAWIPAKFAVCGAYLKILDEDGWRVESVGIFQKEVHGQRGYFAGGVWRP